MAMRNIALRHIDEASGNYKPEPLSPAMRAALLFGLASITLYALLYVFNPDLRHAAELTHRGDKSLFFIPIVIAFVFSLIHGAFTSHFWDVLGLKAKH